MAGNRIKPRFKTIEIVLCGLFVALISIGAKIKIMIPTPLIDLTFSLQWLFVLLAAYLMGMKLGTLSVGAYLIIGLVGVPVFARGGGPQYIFRPGFGFLLGFLAAEFVMGLMTDRMLKLPGNDDKGKKFLSEFARLMIAGVVGLVVYYAVGIVYFYFAYIPFMTSAGNAIPENWSFGFAVADNMITFLPDLLLVVLAALLTVRLRPALKQVTSGIK